MSTVVHSVAAGAVAGAIGTLAMDLIWYKRFRQGGGDQAFVPWETSAGTDSYDGAPAPARTARVVAGKVGIALPENSARVANNAVHWVTGIGWGKAHGMVGVALGTTHPALGLATGVVAWGTSYAVLAPLGIYEPIWKYDTTTLWKDLSAHLVFGATLGVVYRLLAGSD